MSAETKAELKQQVKQYIEDNADKHFLWVTVGIAQPFMDHPYHYPQTEDAGYRRVLIVCNELHKEGILGKFTTTMNENVWYLKSRVDNS